MPYMIAVSLEMSDEPFFFLFGCYYAHFRNFTNPSVAKMCIVTGLFTVFSMILFSE